MESKWYEHFFCGLALELWRKVVTEEQTREEVEFIVDVLDLQEGSSIVDVACGLGRHSIEFARRGYRVTGVDLSVECIARAKQNAAAGLSIDWVHADMTVLDKACGQDKFGGGFCFGNSFGYTDYNGTVDFLRALSASLKSGARFVLDTGLAAESLLPNLQNRRWFKVDDMFMLSEARYDAASSQLQTEYTFIRGDVIQRGTATYSVYTVAEVKRLFAECGLQVEAVYSTTKRDPYQLGSPRLLLIARRGLAA